MNTPLNIDVEDLLSQFDDDDFAHSSTALPLAPQDLFPNEPGVAFGGNGNGSDDVLEASIISDSGDSNDDSDGSDGIDSGGKSGSESKPVSRSKRNRKQGQVAQSSPAIQSVTQPIQSVIQPTILDRPVSPSSILQRFHKLNELRLESWILFFGAIYVAGRTPFLPIGMRVGILALSSPMAIAVAVMILWGKGSMFNGKPNHALIARILFAWSILQAAGQITG